MKSLYRKQVSRLLYCTPVILCCSSLSVSSDEFTDLQTIAEDHTISYKEAVPRMHDLFSTLDDPQIVKAVMLLSSEAGGVAYAQLSRVPEGENGPSEERSRLSAESRRYRKAVFIGMCRLVQIGTSESIKHLVDLTSCYLGEANGEILLQRITEVGESALEHLGPKLQEVKRLEQSADEDSLSQAYATIMYRAMIERLEDLIADIERGEIWDVGIEPCPPSYE